MTSEQPNVVLELTIIKQCLIPILMKVTFLNTECIAVMYRDTYRHLTDITLYELATGEDFMTATVVIDRFVDADQCIIKNYSENTGILQALIKADIITTVLEVIPAGYTSVHRCQLSEEFLRASAAPYSERLLAACRLS